MREIYLECFKAVAMSQTAHLKYSYILNRLGMEVQDQSITGFQDLPKTLQITILRLTCEESHANEQAVLDISSVRMVSKYWKELANEVSRLMFVQIQLQKQTADPP